MSFAVVKHSFEHPLGSLESAGLQVRGAKAGAVRVEQQRAPVAIQNPLKVAVRSAYAPMLAGFVRSTPSAFSAAYS